MLKFFIHMKNRVQAHGLNPILLIKPILSFKGRMLQPLFKGP